MPVVITTNQINPVGLELVDQDPHIIAANVVVEGTAGDGITADNTDLFVHGTVVGDQDGIDFGAGSQGFKLFVGQTGSVFGNDDGVDLDGVADATIAGSIIGQDIGVIIRDNFTDFTITKTGIVRGGSDNNGADGDNLSAAISVLGNAGGANIVNHGLLIGDFNPDNGLSIALVDGAFTGFVPNSASDNFTTFKNSGHVDGDLFFLAGEDVYDARGGGSVDGEILLGLDNDTFFGADLAENAEGNGGDDIMHGFGGEDTLLGGNGADLINGGNDNDTLRGQNGDDTVIGAAGDDSISGDEGDDDLRGSRGDDTLDGGQGRDTLHGGSGDDELIGRNGADILNGGRGNDILTGSGGLDTFEFKNSFGHDTITDFNLSNQEKIDLSAITGIVNPADLFNNHLSQDGADVIFDDLLGNTITIENTLLGDLSNQDFILN